MPTELPTIGRRKTKNKKKKKKSSFTPLERSLIRTLMRQAKVNTGEQLAEINRSLKILVRDRVMPSPG